MDRHKTGWIDGASTARRTNTFLVQQEFISDYIVELEFLRGSLGTGGSSFHYQTLTTFVSFYQLSTPPVYIVRQISR